MITSRPDSHWRSSYVPPTTVYSPRVLKDGADSVGALGALNRVYLNIGLFSEEWLLHFNPLVGGRRVTPIEIAVARKNSSYWEATEAQTPNMALFFLKSTDAAQAEGRARRRGLSHERQWRRSNAARSSSPKIARAATPANCPP